MSRQKTRGQPFTFRMCVGQHEFIILPFCPEDIGSSWHTISDLNSIRLFVDYGMGSAKMIVMSVDEDTVNLQNVWSLRFQMTDPLM